MDIVERLRHIGFTFWYAPILPHEKFERIEIGKMSRDAADEIERLRSRLEKPTPAMLEAGRAANRLVAGNALGLACIAPDAAWAAMANLVLSEDK